MNQQRSVRCLEDREDRLLVIVNKGVQESQSI
jgi:hypothetical protein